MSEVNKMNKQIQHLQNKWKQEEQDDMTTDSMMLSGALVELSEAIESGDFIEAKYMMEEIDSAMAKLREYVIKMSALLEI